jgi:hypothetical protein
MLSFHKTSDKDFPIAHGYNNKECVGSYIFTVYFVNDYKKSSPPAIESDDIRSIIDNESYRIQKEFALSKHELRILVDRVAKAEPVIETSSRTIKRAYLEIQRMISQKLKTTLEFSPNEKVFLKPVFDTMPDRTNFVTFVCGSSGAGKSYSVNDLLMRNPAIQSTTVPSVHLFSSVGNSDPSYRPIRDYYGERFIYHDPRDLQSDALDKRSYRPKSVIIFDDVNSISNKKIRARIVQFRENLLEIARHQSLVIICTEHLFHARNATQRLRNSAAYFILFPRNSVKPIDDVLDTSFTMSRHERSDLIKKLKQEGRSQFLRVDTPSYIINTKRIQLL